MKVLVITFTGCPDMAGVRTVEIPSRLFTTFVDRLHRPFEAWTGSGAVSEFRAHTPILPVLSRQLEEASRDMESEVASVCRSFHGMASRARGSVEKAARLLGSDGEDSQDVAHVIKDCRETMLKLLDRMERSGELSARAIDRMQKVQTSVAKVGNVLHEVDQSAFTSKIIALNARIQAAHLGSAGKSFETVAEEISMQAEVSTKLTSDVAAILQDLVKTARDAADGLQKTSAADREWMRSSRDEIHSTLNALEHANLEMRTSLQVASADSEALAREIDSALVTLQFQDRVSQRIQHVVESLESMYRSVTEAEAPASVVSAAADRQREITAQLAATYTMKSERVAHGQQNQGPAEAEAEPDVELF